MTDKSPEVDAAGLERELRRNVDGEVRFDSGSRALYSTDASNYRQIPIGVVLPRTKEAAIETVRACCKYGAPIVNRGGGTDLCGATCNVAVVIDFSKYLNNVLDIDAKNKTARVQPGLILDHLRDQSEPKHGLTYGPDPATHSHCTFGGMLGNNSCGVHSVMSGRTVDNVVELEVVTYDGLHDRFGAVDDAEYQSIVEAGGRKAGILRDLRQLREHYANLIRQKYPKIPRRVSGYNLDNLLPEAGFHIGRSLVGSESTLVTILEATVRLVDWPKGRALLVLGYPNVFQAGDHIMEILQHKPIGLEGLDDRLIGFMKRKKMHVKYLHLLPEGKGFLMAEFGGASRDEAKAKAQAAMEAIKRAPNPPTIRLYDDPEAEHEVWLLRESGLGATANVPGYPLSWPGWEDAAVPPEKIGQYLRDFNKLLDKHNLIASLYGHFGQGCVHCRISFDLLTAGGVRNYMSFIEEASDLVVEYGGSFSAEHGDGQSKAIFLPKMYGPELMEAFRKFKTIWDPQWKMNPGKVIMPHRPDEDLRLGPAYQPWKAETTFTYPKDEGSFSRASLRCVGVGKCRRTGNAFMCPSFLVTREEADSTRGRSRLLFEMFRGEPITGRWRSKEIRQALDLCLACKGCKGECPVNVDMATYKAEFLSHYYRHRLRPREVYSMGLIGFWANLGSKMPRLANFMSHAAGISAVTKFLGGISQKRQMPTFARQTFRKWFKERPKVNTSGEKILLYPDVFNDCFFPETLRAACELLESFGFQIVQPEGWISAPRAMIHYGMLKLGASHVLRAIRQLTPFLREGVPIIVMEPSTASVFIDDLPELLPQNEDGKRLTQQTLLLGKFVKQRSLPLPHMSGKVILHGHCHEKAILDFQTTRELLRDMGLTVVEPQQGCCGMAGSFGFESRHYEFSMKVGEIALLPAVREAEAGTPVIADGFSCRTQIMEGAGRKPQHLSEYLWQVVSESK